MIKIIFWEHALLASSAGSIHQAWIKQNLLHLGKRNSLSKGSCKIPVLAITFQESPFLPLDYRIILKLSKLIGSSDAIKASHKRAEQAIKCICDCKTESQWTVYSLYEGNKPNVRNTMNVQIASDDTVTYVLVASDFWNRRCSDMTSKNNGIRMEFDSCICTNTISVT